MKRMLGNLQRRSSPANDTSDDTPVRKLTKEVKAFCETAGGPNQPSDDYLHLPAIVEAAESSPSAAKEAASLIRGYLSKPAKPQGYGQYNAVMLIRILADHPGKQFTRNIDNKFVSTIKNFLREGRDMSAQAMLRETLHAFAVQRQWDENLKELIAMWNRENERYRNMLGPDYRPPGDPNYPVNPQNPDNQNQKRQRTLPPADELASRVAEAKNSADILVQLSQFTPASEVANNDLLKEFSGRCQAASKSMQGYINCNNPPPDEDTMLTLIETNERLSVALSKYHRTVLQARRTTSSNSVNRSGTATPNANGDNASYGNNGAERSGSVQSPVSPVSTVNDDPGNRTLQTISSIDSSLLPPENNKFTPAQPYSSDNAEADHGAKQDAFKSHLVGQSAYIYDPKDFTVENPFADPPEGHDERDELGHNHTNGQAHTPENAELR